MMASFTDDHFILSPTLPAMSDSELDDVEEITTSGGVSSFIAPLVHDMETRQ